MMRRGERLSGGIAPRWIGVSLAAAGVAFVLAVVAAFRPPHMTGVTPDSSLNPDKRAPVLLVPGWTDGPGDLQFLRNRFVTGGWDEDEVGIVEFEEPWGGGEDRVPTLEAAISELTARTGSRQVDVVAHSMGGLATRVLLGRGEERIRRVVFMATPHAGSIGAWFAFGPAAEDLRPGSEFVREAAASALRVPALDVVSALDLRVLPPRSARLPGAVTAEVCCPGHKGLLFDREAYEAAERFLTPVGGVDPLRPGS
jgi:triacylglycerol lipase